MSLGMFPLDIARAQGMEAGGFLDANAAVGSDAPVRLFIDENGAEKDARFMRDTTSQKELVKDCMPSLFTGGMRKLMQVSHLRGEDHFRRAGHDLFTYSWSDTCGIFIADAVEGFCDRYVIKISTDGIWRVPLAFSRRLPENWEALEAAAESMNAADAAEAIGRFWSAGDFRPALAVKIADAPALYNNHSGIYNACGWAFDKRGRNAVNVCVKVDPADPTGARKLAVLYRISITADGAGVPNGASVSMLESGQLVNSVRDDNDAGARAILQAAINTPGECMTYSCWPGFGGFTNMPDETNAPVFAYYSGDSLQVVHHKYKKASDPNTTTSGTPGIQVSYQESTEGGDVAGFSGYSPPILAQRGSTDTYIVRNNTWLNSITFDSLAMGYGAQSYTASKSTTEYRLDGPSGYIFQSDGWQITTFGWRDSYTVCGADFHVDRATFLGGVYGEWNFRVNAQGYTRNVTTSSERLDVYDVLILPGTDRTSYVHFRFTGTSDIDRHRTRSGAPLVRAGGQAEVNEGFGYRSMTSWSFDTMAEQGCLGPGLHPLHHEQSGYIYHATTGQNIPISNSTSPGLGPFPGESYTDPDTSSAIATMHLVIGNQVLELDGSSYLTDGGAVSDLYLDGAFFNYRAAGSIFRTERVAYSTYIDADAVAEGFSYPACQNGLHAFLGVF